jgi:Zn-dependent M16 (insulinase) family peptidase
MQARQNESDDLMELAKQRLMFPKGCGYRSNTGGLIEALRVLDVQTIREFISFEAKLIDSYHAAYYVPHNLTLVISGSIDHGALLQVLQDQVESTILTKGKSDLSGWKR